MPKFIFTLLISCLLLVGCQKNKSLKTIYQDFDELQEWGMDENVVTNKAARSGKFSTYTDGNHEYSATYRTDYTRLLLYGYTKVRVSVWIKAITPDPDVSLVISIEKNQQVFGYMALKSEKMKLKTTEWTKVTSELDFPSANEPESQLKVYIWSPKHHEVLIDDMEIEYY